MIHTGDCLVVMRTMPSESVDAIVTDPPAGVSFMSKTWDHNKGGRTEWVAWMTEVMCECYRVLKPGGYAVVWSLPRTCHWTAWAMEDAGFIIRDQLAHIFASGFPKGKAQLKPAREDWWLARKPGPLRPLGIDAGRIGYVSEADKPTQEEWNRAGSSGTPGANGYAGQFSKGMKDAYAEGKIPVPSGRWPSNLLLSDPELFDEPNPGIIGSGATVSSGLMKAGTLEGRASVARNPMPESPMEQDTYGDSGGYSRFFIIPKSSRADREPVVRGQVPFQVAGIGHAAGENDEEHEDFVYPVPEGFGAWLREQREAAGLPQKDVAARFPSKTGGLTGCVANWELELNRPTPQQWATLRETIGFDDRYDEVMTTTRIVPTERFKPNGKEQAVVRRSNSHPTVKPVDLMRHLIRLVTPSGGTVLDPFLGSGSTAIAAELEGFPWIGIEQSAEYVAIAEARLNGTQRGLGLDVGAPTSSYRPPAKMPPIRHDQTTEGHWAAYTAKPDEEPAA